MAKKITPPKKSKNKKIPKSIFARTTMMLGLGASIAAREISGTIKQKLSKSPEFTKIQTRLKQAHAMVEALGQLKGAAMKAGQLLSLEFSDILPPEVVQVLRALHDSSSHMPFADVKKILIKELGKEKFAQLKNLSEEPIAAASIGQVHSATINNEPVVLKVQYPGVAESIDADLGVLKKIITTFISLSGKSMSFDAVFTEIIAGLKSEVDYLQESRSIETFRQAFAKYPQYVIPRVYPEFVTNKVLTMSFEAGDRLNSWLQNGMKPADEKWFGNLIIDLIYDEFFATGLVQTDPNFGNFLIRPKDRVLVLLDFGAVSKFNDEFRENFAKVLFASIAGDRKKILEHAKPFELLDDRESKETKDVFFKLMDTIAHVFKPENQPFDFSNAEYLERIRTQSLEFVQVVRYTSPATKMVFLNRKLGGMYHLLKDAGCRVDLVEKLSKLNHIGRERN